MKYSDILDNLDESSLDLFEADLKEGNIQRYIERKKEFFKIKEKLCPICGNNVNEDCFVLIWGEPSIRKKAHFCGFDCLEYFFQKKLKINDDSGRKHAIKTTKKFI